MEYAENTKITLRSRLANNTRAATAEYTKKYKIHKKHRIHKIHRKKTYIFNYPLNMRDQTNTQNRRIRRTYLFYCPVDVSDL